MDPRKTCECGTCKTCLHRAAVHRHYAKKRDEIVESWRKRRREDAEFREARRAATRRWYRNKFKPVTDSELEQRMKDMFHTKGWD